MIKLEYTWEQFFVDSEKLARIIAPHKPKSLLVVAKGGLILGGMLSEYLDIPIIETVSVSSYSGQEKQELIVHKKALFDLPNPLIIDDIVDSGETLSYLKNEYKAKSAVIFYKPKSAIIKPDFYLHETDKWVKFPWEVEPLK
ncbi:MAG TPA: phosphoribosyltransferase family protein [Candidatus Limnocylindrales bacterium]|nr:phosphoribosyltransferase family protein [Candidatus Limnocylindrales bacterium]